MVFIFAAKNISASLVFQVIVKEIVIGAGLKEDQVLFVLISLFIFVPLKVIFKTSRRIYWIHRHTVPIFASSNSTIWTNSIVLQPGAILVLITHFYYRVPPVNGLCLKMKICKNFFASHYDGTWYHTNSENPSETLFRVLVPAFWYSLLL